MKYTVYFDEWEDGNGWRCSSPIDILDEPCTAEEYINSIDLEDFGDRDGTIAITSNDSNDDFYSVAWLRGGNKRSKMITVLKIEEGKVPQRITIKDSLGSIQDEINDYPEYFTLDDDSNVTFIFGDQCKNNEPINRAYYSDSNCLVCLIAGTFLVAGLTEDGDLESLPEDLMQKYEKKFAEPTVVLHHLSDTEKAKIQSIIE